MTLLGEKLREALDRKIDDEVTLRTLDAWDAHEDHIRKPKQEEQMNTTIKVTNNVMRATFDEVKNNPNKSINDYTDTLVAKGYKKSSVTSVLYQLLRVGQLSRDQTGGLQPAQPEYTPIKSARKEKEPEPQPKRKIVVVRRPKPSEGIAALKADTASPVIEKFDMGAFKHHEPVFKTFDPAGIVDNLSVRNARELYDYLRKLFGGN